MICGLAGSKILGERLASSIEGLSHVPLTWCSCVRERERKGNCSIKRLVNSATFFLSRWGLLPHTGAWSGTRKYHATVALKIFNISCSKIWQYFEIMNNRLLCAQKKLKNCRIIYNNYRRVLLKLNPSVITSYMQNTSTLLKPRSINGSNQWLTQEFCSGGSTNSVEDRGQTERGSGGQ